MGHMSERGSVSLDEMLDARETRACRQRSMPMEPGQAMICFTLNIAGPVKRFELADKTFQDGKEQIMRQLRRHAAAIAFSKEFKEKTGCEEYFVVKSDPLEVKKWMAGIEETGPLGRLFDIDVMRFGGKKVTRGEIGLNERKCIICGKPVYACARSRNHNAAELQEKTLGIMKSCFDSRYADGIASLAVRALLFEVCTTPKPGLVDCENTGSHKDMDIFTFMCSTASLFPYFRESVQCSLHCHGTPDELFGHLRMAGQRAEDVMLNATHGINTHKGIIYSMGTVCSAVGYLRMKGKEANVNDIFRLCSQMTKRYAQKDFSDIKNKKVLTNGEKLFAGYGITGIRGEAAKGFPSVRRIGLPVLDHYLAEGVPLNDAGAITLLYLIGNVQDSNIASRSSPETQRMLQKKISKQLSKKIAPERILRWARRLDRIFINHNISPGGCADLLAVTYFIYFYKKSVIGQ